MATVFPISQCDFSHENVGALFPPLEEGAGRLMTTAEETLAAKGQVRRKATQLLPGSPWDVHSGAGCHEQYEDAA